MRRVLAPLLVVALAAGSLALTGGSAATAGTGAPTFDGPQHEFVSGTSIDVSGTDPNAPGGTVSFELDGVPIGTADVAQDGTWHRTVDLTGLVDDRHYLRITASNDLLMKYLYVNNDVTSLQITSPASGATIASTSSGCIPVTAALAPDTVVDASLAEARLETGSTSTRADVNVQGRTATACLPVKDTPNGDAFLWMWIAGVGRGYVARIPVTLSLTTQIQATTQSGTNGIVVTGTLTDKGPDTVLTASLDGGPAAPVELYQTGFPILPSTPWKFTYWAQAWALTEQGEPYLDPTLTDGPHSITLALTSRGATTTHGPFEGIVDHDGKVVIDSVEQVGAGVYKLQGTLDNALASLWPDYKLYAESYRDGALIEKNTSPTYSWSTFNAYGQDRFTIYVGTGGTAPATIQVAALSRKLETACDAVAVEGAVATPSTCNPVPPGTPTGLALTATSPTKATLTFTPPTFTGGAPILDYTATAASIDRNPFPTFTSAGAAPSISLTGLTTIRDVSVDVVARTAGGTSESSTALMLYHSMIFCGTKPKSKTAIGTSVSMTCHYDNGLRSLYFSPDPVKVTLQLRKPGTTTWTSVSTKTVNLATDFTFTPYLKGVTGTWGLRVVSPAFTAPASYPEGVVRPAISPTMSTLVTGPAPTLTLAVSKSRISYGQSVTFSGKISPWFAGQKVFLMRYINGGWSTISYRQLSTSGSYSFSYKPKSRADLRYMVFTNAANGRPAGSSPTVLLTVL